MRFILLIGCLSLTAYAALVTVKLRNLDRKPPRFPPIHRTNVNRNNVVQLRRVIPKIP
jgi:hypothetical protein